MPYYTKDPNRDHDFDSHPFGCRSDSGELEGRFSASRDVDVRHSTRPTLSAYEATGTIVFLRRVGFVSLVIAFDTYWASGFPAEG